MNKLSNAAWFIFVFATLMYAVSIVALLEVLGRIDQKIGAVLARLDRDRK